MDSLAGELQKTDYYYTVQGWLKAINNPNDTDNSDQDVFSMQLDYFAGDYNKANSGIVANTVTHADYSGNIQQQQWRTTTPLIANLPGNQVANATQYAYDQRYQLQSAIFGSMNSGSFIAQANNAYSTTGLDYDKNGNILGLQRRGQNGTLLHDFTGVHKYQYKMNAQGQEINQLARIEGYKSYTYNAIGQMTEEIGATGSQKLNYDVSGKVTEVKNENDQPIARFVYDDRGFRVNKASYQAGNLVKTTYYVRDAGGSLLSTYEQEASQALTQTEVPVYGSSRLGLYQAVDQRTEYYLTDHLGNTRAIVNREKLGNGDIDVSYYADYFAFGCIARSVGSRPKYGYQGSFAEDETEETGYNSFELRSYDAVVGRWLSVDPYGQYTSPYVGMGNNPVSYVDPDGGYSKAGAWLRNGFSMNGVYESGGEWGFNTQIGDVTTFNYGHTPAPVSPNVLAAQPAQFMLYPSPGTTEPFYMGNDLTDGVEAVANAYEGNWGDAAGSTAAMALPFISWKSMKYFGHTFSDHGQKKSVQSLVDRANTPGQNPTQGQWLNNEQAAKLLQQYHGDGPFSIISIPEGLGQVIRADGTIVPATRARVIPRRDGVIKTAFPVE